MDKDKIKNLGDIGEDIVANYFTNEGCKVIKAYNPYDNKKDMTVDDKTVEVKTQQPHVKMGALTFRSNQLPKCSAAGRLIFVTAEADFDVNYKWNNCLFEVLPGFQTKPYTTKTGVKMIAIPIEQPYVEFIKKLHPDEAFILNKYKQSNYKDGRMVNYA